MRQRRSCHRRPGPGAPAATSAAIGMPSLAKLFQIPETTTDNEVRDFEKPQEPNMAYVRPMATAPPAGTVFATAVVVSVCTSACG